MDPDILSEIADKRQADAQKRAIMKMASGSTAKLVQMASSKRQTTPMRSLQLPKSEPQAKEEEASVSSKGGIRGRVGDGISAV